MLCTGLNAAGWPVVPPRATMFVWAKIPEFYRDMGSLEFSKKLMKEANGIKSPLASDAVYITTTGRIAPAARIVGVVRTLAWWLMAHDECLA